MKQRSHGWLLFFWLLVLSFSLYSQELSMKLTNGPEGGSTSLLVYCKDGSLLASFKSGIYQSSDNGTNWKNLKLPFNGTIFSSPKGDLFIGGANGVVRRSKDNGVTWDSLRIAGLGANNSDAAVSKFSFDSLGNIYTVVLKNSLYKSTDNGSSWNKAAAVPAFVNHYHMRITGKNTFLYSADSCLYRSQDNGATWNQVTNGLPKANIFWSYIEPEENKFFITRNGTIFAKIINVNDYYYSTDDGVSWNKYILPEAIYCNLYYDLTGKLWCFSIDYIYLSLDYGVTWNKTGTITSKPFLHALDYTVFPNGTIFANASGLWRTENKGLSWTECTSGLKETPVWALAKDKDGAVYALGGRKLTRSENGGESWSLVNLETEVGLASLFADRNGNFYTSSGMYVYISKDKCKTWIKSSLNNSNATVRTVFGDGTGRIVTATPAGTYVSTDYGDSWNKISSMSNAYLAAAVESRRHEVFQCFLNTINKSTNNGAAWENLTTTAADSPVMFISSRGTIFVGFSSDIYNQNYNMLISYNNGATWNKVLTGYTGSYPSPIKDITESVTGEIYAAANNAVYVSANNGYNWNKLSLNLNDGVHPDYYHISNLVFDNAGYLYAGASYGVYKSKEPLVKIFPPKVISTTAGYAKVTIRWSKSSSPDFSHYAVYGSSDHYPTVLLAKTAGGVNDTVITIKRLTNDQPWYFTVSAVDKMGNEAYSDEFSETPYTPNPNPEPATPVLSLVPDKSINMPVGITLKWISGEYTDLYSFQLSKDSTFSSLVYNDTTLTDTVKQIAGLQNSARYYWRVRGKNKTGYGQWSDVWQFTTIVALPAAPLASAPINNAANQPVSLTFRWMRSARAETHHFQLSADQNFSSFLINDSTITDTLKAAELLHGTKYYWRVRGKNIAGTSQWSGLMVLTTIVAAPEIPELITPSDRAVNVQVDPALKWNRAARAEAYVIQIARDSLFMDVIQAGPAMPDTLKKTNPLVYEMNYYWRVKAVNAGGESSWTRGWSFRTIMAAPDFPYLSVPLNNSDGQPASPVLKWHKLRDAEKYHVQVSLTNDFTGLVINDSLLTDTLKAAVLKNKISYYWRVRASNTGGFGPWSEAWTFRTIVAKPAVPVIAGPADGSLNQPAAIKLSWNPVQDAENYRLTLFYAEKKGAAAVLTLMLRDTLLTEPFKNVTGLKTGSWYKWQVSAVNAAGASDTAYAGFVTLLPAPSSLTAVSNEMRKVRLSWTDRTDNELGFILERKKEGEAGYKVLDTLKANTVAYTDSMVLPASEYKYRLKSYSSAAASDYTQEAGVKTLTSVSRTAGPLPVAYELRQNFPNPFNPSTVISYSLLTESRVRLAVYNSLGQLVYELVNSTQPEGYYEAVMDAGNLPSGIYIYSLTAQGADGKNNYSATRKMMLVK